MEEPKQLVSGISGKKTFEIVRRVVVRAICPFGHHIVHSLVSCIEKLTWSEYLKVKERSKQV